MGLFNDFMSEFDSKTLREGERKASAAAKRRRNAINQRYAENKETRHGACESETPATQPYSPRDLRMLAHLMDKAIEAPELAEYALGAASKAFQAMAGNTRIS